MLLFVVFIALTASNSNALSCQGGTCSAVDSCVTCGVNTFSLGVSCNLYDDCTSCPGVSTSSQEGAYACTDSTTTECPAGSGEKSGETGCYACDAGTYNDGSSLDCASCSEGSYSLSGSDTCTQCPEGQYTTSEGSSSCSTCPKGETSNSDNTACTECSAGTYNDGSSGICSTCPTGSYSTSAGSVSCTSCGAGYTSNTESTGCTECAAGTYNPEDEGSCSQCSDGYYSAAGATECTYCGSGYISVRSNTDCRYCGPGTRVYDNMCVACPAGFSSSGGTTYCYECDPGYYSEAGGTCKHCSATSYNYYSGSPSCNECPEGECSADYDYTDCGVCTVDGLTASAFSAIIIVTVLFASCCFVTFEWNKIVILAFIATMMGEAVTSNPSEKYDNAGKEVSANPLQDYSAPAEARPPLIDGADSTVATVQAVEEGTVTTQPGAIVTPVEKFEIRRMESTNGYQSIINAEKRHIFDIPYLKVAPHIYGMVNVANQFISFVSFIVSIATSSYFTSIEFEIIFVMFMHVIVSWVAVPIWQTLSIHAPDGSDVSCEKKGCIYCNCCGICCSMLACRSKFVTRQDDGCRYIPFSLYNLIFMIRNPGKQLNNKLSDTLPCFGFGRIYMLLISMNTRGTLNLYIFINALNKVFYNVASQGQANVSTISAIFSLVFAFTDLKVYAFTTVFGLLLLPFTASVGMMFCCLDCCGVVDRLSAKNGTWEFRLFMKFWSYVDKY